MKPPSFVSIKEPGTCREDPDARTPSFFSKRDLVRVDETVLRELKELADRTGDNARLCLHRATDDLLHEWILVQRRDRYYPPHRHMSKAESFHVLEGETLFLAFDGNGGVIDACRLDGRLIHVYRVAPGIYHTNLPLTPRVIVHECTVGPFSRERDGDFAPWAPDSSDREAYLAFRDRLVEVHGISS